MGNKIDIKGIFDREVRGIYDEKFPTPGWVEEMELAGEDMEDVSKIAAEKFSELLQKESENSNGVWPYFFNWNKKYNVFDMEEAHDGLPIVWELKPLEDWRFTNED